MTSSAHFWLLQYQAYSYDFLLDSKFKTLKIYLTFNRVMELCGWRKHKVIVHFSEPQIYGFFQMKNAISSPFFLALRWVFSLFSMQKFDCEMEMPAPLVLWAGGADGANRGKGTFENDLDLYNRRQHLQQTYCNARYWRHLFSKFAKINFCSFVEAGSESRF
jgi:hypothetical protein